MVLDEGEDIPLKNPLNFRSVPIVAMAPLQPAVEPAAVPNVIGTGSDRSFRFHGGPRPSALPGRA